MRECDSISFPLKKQYNLRTLKVFIQLGSWIWSLAPWDFIKLGSTSKSHNSSLDKHHLWLNHNPCLSKLPNSLQRKELGINICACSKFTHKAKRWLSGHCKLSQNTTPFLARSTLALATSLGPHLYCALFLL